MKKFLALLLVTLASVPSFLQAGDVYDIVEHYSGPTSGSASWSPGTPSTVWTYDSSGFGGPWTQGAFNPNNLTTVGSQRAMTVIANVAPTLTGNLNFSTSSAITVQDFSLTPNLTSGILTFTLGGNFSQTATSGALSSITGATSDATRLVIDLNGYNFTLGRGSAGNNAASSFTLNSTAPGGVFTTSIALTDSAGAARIAVNDGATLYTGLQQGVPSGVASYYSFNTAMSANSTLHFAGRTAGTSISTHSSTGGSLNQSFGNLILGDSTTVTPWILAASWSGAPGTPLGRLATVRGNFTMTNNSSISFGAINSSQGIAGFAVGGNYTDNWNTASRTYATSATVVSGAINSTIFFNGGYTSATPTLNERTVLISGTLTKNSGNNLVTSFQVGDGTTGGNIKLGQNLTTSDSVFTVTNNSRLNLANSTLSSAGGITVASLGTIADNFGTITSGVATTTGTLTLNSFNLQLNFDGSAWSTGTITLFTYTTLSGTPTLNSLTLSPGYAAGSLQVGSGLVQITVSAVPEPSTAVLIGAFGGLLVWTVRRKARRA